MIEQVLNDYRTAPIDEKLRATLGLLEKMTLDHAALGPSDMLAVMCTGVSREAIQEALEVAFLFNIYDRLADALGWDVPPVRGGYYKIAAQRLLRRGYG